MEILLCQELCLPGTGRVTQAIVPAVLFPHLSRHLHGGPLTDHLAYDKVLACGGIGLIHNEIYAGCLMTVTPAKGESHLCHKFVPL